MDMFSIAGLRKSVRDFTKKSFDENTKNEILEFFTKCERLDESIKTEIKKAANRRNKHRKDSLRLQTVCSVCSVCFAGISVADLNAVVIDVIILMINQIVYFYDFITAVFQIIQYLRQIFQHMLRIIVE